VLVLLLVPLLLMLLLLLLLVPLLLVRAEVVGLGGTVPVLLQLLQLSHCSTAAAAAVHCLLLQQPPLHCLQRWCRQAHCQ
jgi:hypothetical protein